ncbi:hypothetical protein EJ110_NYTH33947 [Nymphaea thermarum]|nr:hypothetical protein EJ110_NYTH33947 [Nymphaea thermarum]
MTVEKTPGCSWVEVGGQIYTFVDGDRSHVQKRKNYFDLQLASYLPGTRFALLDVDLEEKEVPGFLVIPDGYIAVMQVKLVSFRSFAKNSSYRKDEMNLQFAIGDKTTDGRLMRQEISMSFCKPLSIN